MKKFFFMLTAFALSIYGLFAQEQTSKLKIGDKAPDFQFRYLFLCKETIYR